MLYLVLLMTMMNFMSHGTQDLYPTFLQQQRHYDPRFTAIVSVISMLGAILGGIVVGRYSDRVGRRKAMVTAAIGGLLVIPLWVFSPGIALIAVGAFLMQFMVQGVWGVIPAHINELSPDRLRGFPAGLRVSGRRSDRLHRALHRGRSPAASPTPRCWDRSPRSLVFVAMIVIASGPEAHRVEFGREAASRQSGSAR